MNIILGALTSYHKTSIPSTLYLPAYTISPEEIFQGKILLFNVNFFDSGKEIYAHKKVVKEKEEDRGPFANLKDDDSENTPWSEQTKELTGGKSTPWSGQIESLEPESHIEIDYYFYKDDENGEIIDDDDPDNPDYYVSTTYDDYETSTSHDILMDHTMKVVKTSKQNMAVELNGVIKKWYVAIRNIAIVAMMIILLYIGIRILLSTLASDKAKYKQMLQDWFIGLLLLFMMHYIMAFSVVIVEKVTEVVGASVDKKSFYSIIPISDDGGKADKFKNFIKSAGMEKYYIDANKNGELINKEQVSEKNAAAIIYPSNLLGYIRIGMELSDFGTLYMGQALCFIILVLMTLYFVFTYLRRVLYMAFLTIIAPMVAMTYPIDKINDGSAQGFSKWFKEYIFNLLLQPLHLLLYYILVTSAWNLSASNILYSIVALGFMIPAEKLLRSFFGFEKAHTPGLLAGPAGAALTMSAISKIANIGKGGGKGKSEKGGSNGDSSDNDTRTPRMNGDVDEREEMIGAHDDEDNNNNALGDTINTFPDQDMNDYYTGRDRQEGLGDNTDIDARMAQMEEDYNFATNPEYIRLAEERDRRNAEQQAQQQGQGQQRAQQEPQQQRQQSKIRRLARRAGRSVRANAIAAGSLAMNRTKKILKPSNVAKNAIRYSTAIGTGAAFGAMGLAAGVAGGSPRETLQYATGGGLAGYALGKNLTSGAPSSEFTQKRDEIKNQKQYDDINRDKYIKDFKAKNKTAFKHNFDNEKAEQMLEAGGNVEKFLDNGIDNVEDMVAAQRMIDDHQVRDVREAIATAKYAKRVGSDYNTNNASKWEEQFTKEYVNKSGLSEARAKETSKRTMERIEKFNKQKKNIYK